MTVYAIPKPAKRSKPTPTPAERKAAAHAREVASRARARKRAQKAARIAKRKAAPMSSRKLEKLADELHSIWLRAARDGCELAIYPEHRAASCIGLGAHPSALQCAHGWSRGCKAVRFDPANTWSACAFCHTKYSRGQQASDAQWHDWMALRLGEQVYQALRERSRKIRKWQAWELVLVIRERLAWIADLPDTLLKEWAQERVASLSAKIRRALENTSTEGRA